MLLTRCRHGQTCRRRRLHFPVVAASAVSGDVQVLEAEYPCPSCGEVIVIPVDPSEGETQTVIEDCPVCCAPNELTICVNGPDRVSVTAVAS